MSCLTLNLLVYVINLVLIGSLLRFGVCGARFEGFEVIPKAKASICSIHGCDMHAFFDVIFKLWKWFL